MSPNFNKSHLLCLAVFLLMLTASFSPENEDDGENLADSSFTDSEIVHTSDSDCISCHGNLLSDYPSIAQVRTGDCLDCHSSTYLRTEVNDWTHPVSDFAFAGKKCLDCHTISDTGEALPPEKGNRICLECHKDVRREINLIGRHPVSEGLTECLDCHRIHDSGRIAIKYADIDFYGQTWLERHDPLKQNAACLTCHPYFTLTGLRSSGFVIANTQNLHELHLERTFSACIECHATHGTFAPKLIKDLIDDGTPLIYMQSDGIGTCSVKCHSHTHMQVKYGSDPERLSQF